MTGELEIFHMFRKSIRSSSALGNTEGEKNHKRGGGLNCVFENFFLTF